MSAIDLKFQNLSKKIIDTGRVYDNKNRGVKRLQIPSYTFRHDFSDGFPAISIKELYWKGVTTELIWFMRGDTDVKYLNDNKVRFWNKDAYNWYVKKYSNNDPIEGQEEFYHKNEDGTYRMFTLEEFSSIGEGSVGRNYSAQWRDFRGYKIHETDGFMFTQTDQLSDVISQMKEDIMSSRIKLEAWNPAEVNETALPPCHTGFQIVGVPLSLEERISYANENGLLFDKSEILLKTKSRLQVKEMLDKIDSVPEFGFELHWDQRSVDVFLGLPLNIASYALLAKFLEKITGYPALGIEGNLKCVHFYENQYEAAQKLIARDSIAHSNCGLLIAYTDLKKDFDEKGLDYVLEKLVPHSFQLLGYESDEAIKVEMLAPTTL